MYLKRPLVGRTLTHAALACVVCLSACGVNLATPEMRAAITPEMRAAVERITADSLRGHLSFIASDALEGRGTPSRGQEIAAEYIAAQFRRAGLEPAGDDGGYFQTATLTARLAPDGSIRARNVAGLLRGADPKLRDTYVLVSAHYDHLGAREGGAAGADNIFNGANDDGSGTVGVIEIAAALATLRPRPRRSILFIAFTGEELGLRGSRYYGQHPLVPIERTVAQINMEQVGRTDDSEGPQVGTLAVTGFDYSEVGAILKAAGAATGTKVYKHPINSDAFFGRSDNQSLADQGVPAHTVGVAFEFPDYHGVGDQWEKIDYANMEKIVRTIATGVLMIAEGAQEPRWNESNPNAARYLKAWREHHSG